MYLSGSVQIISDKTLEEIGAFVSERLFAGVHFGGREDYIYDEVPAIYVAPHILGLRITLQGYGGEEKFSLRMHNTLPLERNVPPEVIRSSVVDISGHVSQLLEGAEGCAISFKGFAMRLACSLEIISDKSLEEVAALISEKILGGVPFIGRDEHIYDEIPAIYAERDVFGLRVILQGYGRDEPYVLEMRPREPLDPLLSPDFIRKSVVDISGYVSRLLQGIDGVSVSFK